jgi:branched-chain amino acid aminotransferase
MVTSPNSKFIINNRLRDISELPATLCPGSFTIYEVVRMIRKKILFLEDHLQRFFDSCKILSINPKLTKQEISEQLQFLINSTDIQNGNIKFQVQINKANGQDFICYFVPHSYPTGTQYKNGVRAAILNASRVNPNAKVQDTSLRDMADQIIKTENVYEVILINDKGLVTEGSQSNIFMIKNDVVKTPQIKDILPGITRKYIIHACSELHIQCIESQISSEEMNSMDALFITGTSPKVLPVCKIYDHLFDVNNQSLRAIMKKFDEMTNNYLKS